MKANLETGINANHKPVKYTYGEVLVNLVEKKIYQKGGHRHMAYILYIGIFSHSIMTIITEMDFFTGRKK